MCRNKTALCLLLAVLIIMTSLPGCSYLEFQKDKRNLEQRAKEQALAYISETYGKKAKVLDVKIGTYQVVFSAAVGTNALVSMSMGGEEFQVYVETKEPAFCADNRSGLALAQALDEYFRELYSLPPALEHQVWVYSTTEGFFASHSTNLGREYNFLDFDYHGQLLEEVLPLLGEIYFKYNYADDTVSLSHMAFREEDWGGSLDRLRVWVRSFRCYDETSETPVGIQLTKEQPVLMAEGMVFSWNSDGLFYADLDKIASALPHLALRESLHFRQGEAISQRYTLTPMGNFWVSTQEGFDPEECYELRPCEPGWADSIDLLALCASPYYTREEIKSDDKDIMAASTKKALLPFADTQFQTQGEMLCLRNGVSEQIQAWQEQAKKLPYMLDKCPVYVTVLPSLVYRSGVQTGVGWYRQRDEEPHRAARLFTYYLDQQKYWMHGLSFLSFSYPEELVLLRSAEEPGNSWQELMKKVSGLIEEVLKHIAAAASFVL